MEIIRYNTSFREDWNHFVRSSRNGTFLFEREYMEYHADRFTDHSLLFYKQGKIKGVLPANEQGNRLFSHQGLTYGGLVMGPDTLSVDVEMIFAELIPYLKEQNIDSLVYKMIPAIYWKQPAAEDAYFLFRMHAQKIACALSSTINLHSLLPYNRERKRAVRRATEAGLFILETTDMNLFWPVMEENMERRFGVKPVHTVEEMTLLQSRFPDNIRLFLAMEDQIPLAGALIYDTGQVIRIQYGHASQRGKELGALDLVYDHLIRFFSGNRNYLDFGQCTEQNGQFLNAGLIHQKESFGGRGTLYDIYQIDLLK